MATPGMPPMPVDDAAESWRPPQQAGQQAEPQEATPKKGSRVGGIIATLLGWKHAEEEWKKQQRAAYLSHRIYTHINDPNDIQPDDVVDKKVNELEKMIGSNGVIKAEVDAKRKARATQADYRNKQAMLAQPRQAQAPPVVGTAPSGPDVPAADDGTQMVPQPQPAQPQQPAQPTMLPGSKIPEMLARPQLPAPPGGAAPVPFGSGGGNAEAPPLQNEPPAMKLASATGGAGSGVPVPITPQRPTAPQSVAPEPQYDEPQPSRLDYRSPNFLSADERAMRTARAAIAGQRITNAYDEERIAAGLKRLETLGIDIRKLRPSQITKYLKEGEIPELKGEVVSKDQLLYFPDNTVVGGVREPIHTPAGSTTTLPAPTGGVPAGTRYDPNNPMKNAPAGIGGSPATPIGERTISGGPALSTAQQGANAWWAAKHPGETIGPENYAEAMSGFAEQSMSASAKQLRDAQITTALEAARMRKLQEQHLQQTILEYNRTKGPDAIDRIVDQVRLNPEAMQSLSPEIKGLVIQAFPQKFGLPAPRQIPALAKTQEINSQLALSNVAQMREALKNPVVQKRIGAWDGRLGNVEQAFGNTVGLKDDEKRAIQKFRSGLTYLFMQEGKSMFSGRAPQALMEDLRKTSPNVKMELPVMLGSLDAVEDLANGVIKNANDYRYGGSAMANPPAGTPTKAASTSGSQLPTGHSVGDIVKVRGKDIKITVVYPDGTFDGNPVAKK